LQNSTIPVYRYERVDSTQDEAKRRLAMGTELPLAVLALQQSSGRGRHGRVWHSDPGNFYATFALQPPLPFDAWPQLSYVAALAVRQGLINLGGDAMRLRLKWPNDILADNQKIAGILLESTPHPVSQEQVLLLGIGVNLLLTPPDTVFPATNFRDFSGQAQTPDALLQEILSQWEWWLRTLQDFGFSFVQKEWLCHVAFLGKNITIRPSGQAASQALSGVFAGLAPDGALLLQTTDGQTHRVLAGQLSQESD
jgi:BirA family transcriptional regulator, biotin operon repressor / biotin---[acetyl-CoA-carboxylase] ligase